MRSAEEGSISFGDISQIHGEILQVDSEGDGNGVVTIEEWVGWKLTKDSGDLGTPAGKGRRGERAKIFQVGNG